VVSIVTASNGKIYLMKRFRSLLGIKVKLNCDKASLVALELRGSYYTLLVRLLLSVLFMNETNKQKYNVAYTVCYIHICVFILPMFSYFLPRIIRQRVLQPSLCHL